MDGKTKHISKRVLTVILSFILVAGMVAISTLDVSAAKKKNSSSKETKSTTTEVTGSNESDSPFWVEYIDVGQGDAALIACDGHYMMIDGGPSSASSVVYTILKNKDIKELDYMIATHPDEDHIGGLSGALNYATVGTCYSPVTSHTTKTFKSLVKYLKKQDVELTVPAPGDSFNLGSAVVEILGPIEEGTETNNNSIITKITYGSTSFLFMGDAEYEEETSLITNKADLKCDVLKVGHHGSKSSTSSVFFRKTEAQYAVISVGTDNSYQHPTEDTLGIMKSAGVSLYRTDMQGDIVCSSDGKKVSFSTEKKASDEALWIAGGAKDATMITDGVVVAAPKAEEIPSDVTYVVNKNSKKFHDPNCSSVKKIKEKNKAYSTDTAEELVAAGYDPCGSCKPYVIPKAAKSEVKEEPKKQTKAEQPKQESPAAEKPVEQPKQEAPVVEEPAPQPAPAATESYVLNTNTHKFHRPGCASVAKMKDSNRQDVNSTRDEIIGQGYDPCKNCKP